jgi:hypothetical protein
MTVFRSKTFKKNRAARRKNKKTVRRTKSKQRGGYVPYRGIPKGAVFADLLDWDDQKDVPA